MSKIEFSCLIGQVEVRIYKFAIGAPSMWFSNLKVSMKNSICNNAVLTKPQRGFKKLSKHRKSIMWFK